MCSSDLGAHKIQGIGAGFIPSILEMDLIDEVIKVSSEESYNASRDLGKKEGVLMGVSGGAALAASIKVSKKLGENKKILYIVPDNGERYLSTDLYNL